MDNVWARFWNGSIAQEVRVESEVTAMVQSRSARRVLAASANERHGRLLPRAVRRVNELLSATETNLNEVSACLNRVAQGDLSQTLDRNYQGIFAQLQSDVNKMTGQARQHHLGCDLGR